MSDDSLKIENKDKDNIDISEIHDIQVENEFVNCRLDRFLTEKFKDMSRSFIQKQIKDGLVKVNRKAVKSSYKLQSGDNVQMSICEPKDIAIVPENIPLDIIYEDSDIILINKPKQMVVHPAPGHYSGTIVNALMYHCDDLSGINGELRPGIVHRIDQDTTGVIVACKNDKAHRCIAEQLKEHSITRTYHAIVHNHVVQEEGGHLKQSEGTIEGDIGRHPVDRKKMAINVKNGKKAVTHYKVLDTLNNKYTYIECKLETGRTHQIRVHMSYIGHPLMGDTVYGGGKTKFEVCNKALLSGQCLHAVGLRFLHPRTHEVVELSCPLPEEFTRMLQKIRK